MPTIEVSDEFIAQRWLRENNLIAIEVALMERVNALPGVALDAKNLADAESTQACTYRR